MSEDRDSQLDRALARHLRNASPAAFCPDAEILAAYHEGTLPTEEMARWKDHLARCGNCQETLAIVEKTESVTNPQWASREVPVSKEALLASGPVSASRLSSRIAPARAAEMPAGSVPAARALPMRRPLRWLLPLGALAAAVLVWVGLREREAQRIRSVASEVAENRAMVPPPNPPPAMTAADSLSAPASKTNPDAKPAGKPAATATKPAAAPDAAKKEATDGAYQLELRKRQAELDSVLAQRDSANQLETGSALGGRTVVREHAPQAPAPGSPSKFSNNARASQMSAAMIRAGVPNDDLLRKISSGDAAMILAPGNQQAWFVGKAGRIFYSGDAGRTWLEQSTNVTADLITGASPASDVVWVVGKSGTILLTKDAGAHWQKLVSPVPGDLGGIRAIDGLQATVWDLSHNRFFATVDGGLTWTPGLNP